jgi:putative membrane protein
MMYWYGAPSGWGYGVMVLSMLAFWGLLVAGVVVLARWLTADRRWSAAPASSAPHPAPAAPGDPGSILRERFARGEIDETEYRHRLSVLNGS